MQTKSSQFIHSCTPGSAPQSPMANPLVRKQSPYSGGQSTGANGRKTTLSDEHFCLTLMKYFGMAWLQNQILVGTLRLYTLRAVGGRRRRSFLFKSWRRERGCSGQSIQTR